MPIEPTQKKTKRIKSGGATKLLEQKRSENKKRIIEAFKQTARIDKAAKIVGISRCTVYEWMSNDQEFFAAMGAAQKEATGLLEDEAVRRAREGVKKPVYQQGKLVGHVQEYSDTLLIFLLKCWSPDKYGQNGQRDDRKSAEVTIKMKIEDDGPTLEPLDESVL